MLIDWIRSAQRDDEDAMLYLITRFEKLIRKYARKMQYEDAENDLTLDFIELIKTLDIKKLNNSSDGAVVNFLVQSTYHFYLKRLDAIMKRVRNETVLINLDLTQNHALEEIMAMYDDFSVSELFPPKLLTKNEEKILIAIYQEGYSVSDIAASLHVSRQNINQIKKRAEAKLRKNWSFEK